ncbi:MAG: aldo/keto reductase [Candidatus Wolfebacteria bacterium]|nr:aldo/keto reductase [Candidatus Wolfebacteria bacterium]
MDKILSRLLGRTEKEVSLIGLGTAEIGFAYGIGERHLPSDDEADYLLKAAADMGVTYFDTAHVYALSEERIGRSGILKNPDILVGTKCAQFLEKGEKLPYDEMELRVRDEVETSLKKLQLDVLPLLYLHGGTRVDIEKGEVTDILSKIRSEGKVKNFGISLRGEDNALAAIESGFFDVIQVAYSILDQRMAKEVLPYAKKSNVGVVNRSVLLKGSLTPLRAKLPDELASLKLNADKADNIAKEAGMDLPTLAIRFAISNESVTSVLVGTNRKEHLKSMISAISAGPLSEDTISALQKLAIDDPKQVDPALWPKL